MSNNSGIVIITYPGPAKSSGGTVTTVGSNTVHTFTESGTLSKKKPWEWQQHYTWIPRRINGRWYWREYVYRYWCLSPGGGFWRYGDEFSILKDE